MTLSTRLEKEIEKYNTGQVEENDLLIFMEKELIHIELVEDEITEQIYAALKSNKGKKYDTSGYDYNGEVFFSWDYQFYFSDELKLPSELPASINKTLRTLCLKARKIQEVSPISNAIVALRFTQLKDKTFLENKTNAEVCSWQKGSCAVAFTSGKSLVIVYLKGSIENGWLPDKLEQYKLKRGQPKEKVLPKRQKGQPAHCVISTNSTPKTTANIHP
jgi:hypothetical protein